MHTDDCLEAREDACGDCGSVGFRFVVWSIASIHDHDVDDDDDDVNDAGKHDYGDEGAPLYSIATYSASIPNRNNNNNSTAIGFRYANYTTI